MHCSMRGVSVLAVTFAFFAFPTIAQQGAIYTATAIPAVAQSGGSTKIRIQIVSYTTEAERAELKEAFSKDDSDKGAALLRTMSKGYINIAGQSGRKILAAVTLDIPNGKRLILITEHVLSEYEKTQNIHAEDYPLTILRIQFDAMGKAQSGEVCPAAKLSVTKDGFLDLATQSPDTATLIDIVRAN
jgi:hypothetical protein